MGVVDALNWVFEVCAADVLRIFRGLEHFLMAVMTKLAIVDFARLREKDALDEPTSKFAVICLAMKHLVREDELASSFLGALDRYHCLSMT